MRTLFQVAYSGPIVKNSMRIALMVGSILNLVNLVNQGSAILEGTDISWLHGVLNYVVPYCVASYSAASNELTPRGINDGDFDK